MMVNINIHPPLGCSLSADDAGTAPKSAEGLGEDDDGHFECR